MSQSVCYKCQQQIAPNTPLASFENRSYHPGCLTCKMCKKSVSGERFLKDKNQDIICEKCDSVYGPTCKKCRKGFKPGTPYKRLDENLLYHTECFTCYGPCRKPLEGEFYDLDDENFICVDCYDKYGARKNYDDLVSNKSEIVEIMSTKPLDNYSSKPYTSSTSGNNKVQDDDVSNLSSTFSIKLNTSSNNNNEKQTNNKADIPNNKQEINSGLKESRFDNNESASTKKGIICQKCGEIIQGTYSVYEEKTFHPACFVCNICSKPFKEKQFFKLNGSPVCAKCHEDHLISTSKRCKKCMKPILDTIVTFMNEEYHENCLNCTLCNRTLVGMSIYTDKQNSIYCLDCYTKKEAKICAKCSKTISPNQSNIIFEDLPYHKECFICDTCKRVISADESFYKRNNEVICSNCSSENNSSF